MSANALNLPDQLDLIASTPEGIQKLRGLILELAVRGKLVPQDPNDEPASELLKRIAKERARLEAEGVCKKSKATPLCTKDAPPFELPAGWVLSQLSDLTLVLNGRAYAKDELLSEGVPVLRVGNLFTSNHWYYSNLQLEDDKYCDQGDLLYSWSASFGPFIWQGQKVIYHYHIWKLRLFDESSLSKEYFYKFLLEKTAEIKAAGHGVSMIHMTKEKMEKILVPVPPLAEQHRIVAKVDELMALCDDLEEKVGAGETAHAKLVDNLLGTLTQSTDAAELAANWQRLAKHFDSLFTTESSLDALKQTILQLAVMGKLVPQDPNDEPASELLKRIAKERAQLEAEGKIKKSKPMTQVSPDEEPFVLPEGWSWVRFNDLINPESPISYGVLVPGPDVPDGIPFVRLGDLDIENPPAKPEKSISVEVDKQYGRTRLAGGEILMGVVGSIGKLGIAPSSWKGANIARAVCRIEPIHPIDRRFIVRLLQSQFMQTSFVGDTRTLAQPTLNVGLIREAVTPLPPLAEQQRIVAKVDELMVLCDGLKAKVGAGRTAQERLAATLIETALKAA